MCYYVLVGAEAEGFQLRDVLSGDGLLDTDVTPDEVAAHRFPATDTLVCVTVEGCSCCLLETPVVGKVGRQHKPERDAFYAGLSRATARFGSIRLLVLGGEGSTELATSRQDGTTTLRELLRTRRPHAQRLLSVVA
ncbi:MAG TPA: hypothetical protein VHP33_35565 [Polyangiaceae bacterium]|nr:hypothetical protein [Polyangiaceae bacterium]